MNYWVYLIRLHIRDCTFDHYIRNERRTFILYLILQGSAALCVLVAEEWVASGNEEIKYKYCVSNSHKTF